jgi:hypothetical protein
MNSTDTTNFADTLRGAERVMYRAAHKFHTDHAPGATPESAHRAGLAELERIKRIRRQAGRTQTYVDLSTGKKFKGRPQYVET